MVKKILKEKDGFYHIKHKKFPQLEGSRASVWHDNAYKTSGGLTKDKLMKNKHGHIVYILSLFEQFHPAMCR